MNPPEETPRSIEFAPQDRVDAHPVLLDDFIHRVLELEGAFISDESSLWDFHMDMNNDELLARIKRVYSIDVSDIESGNIADILERIAAKR
jgi:hypothetical protein